MRARQRAARDGLLTLRAELAHRMDESLARCEALAGIRFRKTSQSGFLGIISKVRNRSDLYEGLTEGPF